jgi:hypothetical protein
MSNPFHRTGIHSGQTERDDEPEWAQSLRHDWSLPNIMSDRMLDSLTEPPPRIHWAEVGDDEL